MRRWRRAGLLGGTAALVVALAVWWAGAGAARPGAAPVPVAPARARMAPPAPSAGSPATAPATPAPRVAVQPPREPPQLPAGGLGRAAAESYRRRARYPRSSEPLVDVDTIRAEREVTQITERGPRGEEPALTVYPAAAGFEWPESAVLHAFLSVDGERVRARGIRGTILTEDLRPLVEVVYRDDGTGGDAVAGDDLYTAVIAPGPEHEQRLSESYLVKVVAVGLEDTERRAATSFLYSRPDAHLTGRYRDAVVDGSLVVGAEVDVAADGRFHLEATLYGGDGDVLLARAQTAAELVPGRHWMELPFYGLILRERGVPGPYLLRWVALSTTTAMPNAKNRLVEAGHVTGAYALAAFTDRPFDDPELLDAAARAERDLAPGLPEAGG